MAVPAHKKYISAEEYLRREKDAETRHEYFDGVIVAMAGASEAHAAICYNLPIALAPQLRGRSCRGFSSDMRVRVVAHNRYYYPDISVACATPQLEVLSGVQSLLNPTLIIEVLSDSTERLDRGDKWIAYQTIESLRVYLLISQHKPLIEAYMRQENGKWAYTHIAGLDSVLSLDSIGLQLHLTDVYADVEFPQEAD